MLLIKQINNNENLVFELKDLLDLYYKMANSFLNANEIDVYRLNILFSKIESIEEELEEIESKNKDMVLQLMN